MASETWSAILSGWPSVTDSEVNKKRSLNFKTPSHFGIELDGCCWVGEPGCGARQSREIPHHSESIIRPFDSPCPHALGSSLTAHPCYGNCRGSPGAKTCSVWQAMGLQRRIGAVEPGMRRTWAQILESMCETTAAGRGPGSMKRHGDSLYRQHVRHQPSRTP